MGMETLLLVAISQQPQTTVGEHTVTIHQKKFDVGCAALNCSKIFH